MLCRAGQIEQGRIDAFWQRLADRYGDVVAGYLRDRVDPLFIRLRDRVTGRARRNAPRTQAAQAEGQETPTESTELQLLASGQWQLGCNINQLTYTIVINETATIDAAAVEFGIDLDSRTFQVDLTGSGHSVDADGAPDESTVWNISGGGHVTEDGLFYGSGRHITDSTWLTDRYTYEPTDYNFPITWIGVIADDLQSFAFSVCDRPDSIPTFEEFRALGRGALSGAVACGGYSILRCTVDQD